MAERHERAALRLAHRPAAMSAVWRPATMEKTTERPLSYVPFDHDAFTIPRDVLDYPDDERRGSRHVGSHKFPRFSRDARELQSLPPYLPVRWPLSDRRTR
ncbi:hypothetical protein ALC60_13535 [Trachymyrmex zeteki]|uniref:Uncharacterized protein n=1 Tax=Mycetomoellerius zeteki TaxID=64791 RepID=A0A151WHW6_9HYME|nr:hypothetical protein ALC60_13535 [Trachymyrmex zeteki]